MSVWKRVIACGIAGALYAADVRAETVVATDNLRAAGVVADGVVTIRLRAATGTWRPEGETGPVLTVDAFGSEGAPLSVPAPLIRVKEGDRVVVSVRNDLPSPLRVHGLCARDGARCEAIDVEPGATRSVSFTSGAPGTYHYWATALGAPMPFRELAGALVIDPRDGRAVGDRIFVITEWSDLTVAQLREILSSDDSTATFMSMRPKAAFLINGLSWLDVRAGSPEGSTVIPRTIPAIPSDASCCA